MSNPDQPKSPNLPTSSRQKNDTVIFRTLLVLFLSACIITITSHHLVNSDLAQKEESGVHNNGLLSVPKPRARQAAKGGLPPIPDFVKKQTAGMHK
jgi:hypothetical protein